MWGGGKRSVGLAEDKLDLINTIKIVYRDYKGKLIYPDTYFIARQKALQYPTMTVKGGVVLRVIPIAELEKAPKPADLRQKLI